MARRAYIIVAAVFLAVIMAPGLIQTVSELRYGEQPAVLDIFLKPPTARNLHAYEREPRGDESRGQAAPAAGCSTWSGGSSPMPVRRSFSGVSGWLFYRPSVRYVIERQTGAS